MLQSCQASRSQRRLPAHRSSGSLHCDGPRFVILRNSVLLQSPTWPFPEPFFFPSGFACPKSYNNIPRKDFHERRIISDDRDNIVILERCKDCVSAVGLGDLLH